jgi:hypothetical protein
MNHVRRPKGRPGQAAAMASFSTISMMRETPDVVSRFARYYLRNGAREVIVFCDGPLGDVEGVEIPGLRLVAADAAFWSAHGLERPAVLGAMVGAAAQIGLGIAETDWALIADGDEFVFGDRPIEAFLDRVPADVDAVRVPTAEAVWGPDDDIEAPFGCTHFRILWPSPTVWRVLKRPVYGGRLEGYFRRGMIGHTQGKEFLRVGRTYTEITPHFARRDGRELTRDAASLGLGGMHLGHFDAIGLDRWVRKWRNRIDQVTISERMNPSRWKQMEAVEQALSAGSEATRALFRGLYGLTRTQYAVISAMGAAFRRDIFPDG